MIVDKRKFLIIPVFTVSAIFWGAPSREVVVPYLNIWYSTTTAQWRNASDLAGFSSPTPVRFPSSGPFIMAHAVTAHEEQEQQTKEHCEIILAPPPPSDWRMDIERDNVVYWKTNRKIKNDLQWMDINRDSNRCTASLSAKCTKSFRTNCLSVPQHGRGSCFSNFQSKGGGGRI